MFLLLSMNVAWGATYYQDVRPILDRHCANCHRPQGIAPMAFATYAQARPWAKAIGQAVATRKMPPWFAEPEFARHFSNDPSLSAEELSTIASWVREGAPEGRPVAASVKEATPWSIGTPDAVFAMPRPFAIPSKGEIEYQYVIVPTGFAEDRWVQKVEVAPGNRRAVHHAVVYVREPGSKWLRESPVGVPFAVSGENPDSFTTSDLLHTYTPGNPTDQWPDGMAKLIPAGSDLVLQLHYTAGGGTDRTRVGVVFARSAPQERVMTLQLGNDHFVIPPGVPGHRVQAWGTLPNAARLVGLFPHMHLRGDRFEYRVTPPGGRALTLLRVSGYDFQWQLNYRLAEPLNLPAGTLVEVTGTFDNSKLNPRNPDPGEAVRFGFQSREEMMIGFFDVAVPANVDKEKFFLR